MHLVSLVDGDPYPRFGCAPTWEEGETKERARSAEHGSRSETLGDVPGHGKRFL